MYTHHCLEIRGESLICHFLPVMRRDEGSTSEYHIIKASLSFAVHDDRFIYGCG